MTQDNPNHLYIPRHELKKLVELLEEIPDLSVDLGITVTKQARLGDVGRGSKPRRPSEQPLPYHLGASEAAEALHNALTGWARLVCEQRAIDYHGKTSTAGVARWLHRNIIALAMTEGSETALEEIGAAVDRARWVVCPPEVPWKPPDEHRVAEARRLRLNSSGIAALAPELDERYRNLTQRRVDYLRESGKIKPVPGPWHPDWPMLYVVGEVLDAHLQVQIKRRHVSAA